MVRAIVAGVGIAIVTGPLGCFVVWRRLAYFGETIAHSALLGVAIAVLTELNLVVGIFGSSILVVALMYFLERSDKLPTETLLGLLAHGGLAVGLVTLSFFPTMRIDLQALLFGDILAVSLVDLVVVWVGGLIVLAILCFIWRALLASTVNVDLAKAAGLNVDRARLIFGVLMAAVIAGAVKIVGILLIVALLVIPAAASRRLATSPENMAIGAVFVGVVSVIAGLYASAEFDTPSGPSIVVAALLVFVISRISFAWLLKR